MSKLTKKYLVSFIIGTRPEAIKLAPLIIIFKKCSIINTRVILTGQHQEMLKQVFDLYELKEDLNLNIMQAKQTLNDITIKSVEGITKELKKNRPNLVLIQGDTSTTFAAALSCFYEKIPFGHVEAGLRTDNIYNPYPEEVNRRLVSQMASLNFAPTKHAFENLKRSDLIGDIHLTGNTVIDALMYFKNEKKDLENIDFDFSKYKLILATVHRRENWGENLLNISNALKTILDNNPIPAYYCQCIEIK